ncbi:MAG: archaetidylserine decarboxylase [Candidatus Lightella neohaematopini]|nr:archaetidylserine decarboxylase [Candidatus Lightella neohaematopini]
MIDKLKLMLLFVIPKHLLTKLFGKISELKLGYFTHLIIKIFIYIYNINIYEIKEKDITKYYTFNDFFTRSLKQDARIFDNQKSTIILPADGYITQCGNINYYTIVQAKNIFYNLTVLLSGNKYLSNKFINGVFINIYLSPANYHRIHMPCNGILKEMIYVPGKLLSLNKFNINNKPDLFTKNERLICLFNTKFGLMIQILIGSTIVGSIETTWYGTVIPPRSHVIKHWCYTKKDNIFLLKGQEMGKFKLGSTVITIFEKNSILLCNTIKPNIISYVGNIMGYGIPNY